MKHAKVGFRALKRHLSDAVYRALKADAWRLDDPDQQAGGSGGADLVGHGGRLTFAVMTLAVRLHVGIPGPDSTQIADVARATSGNGGLYAFFPAASALLLAAASSSF